MKKITKTKILGVLLVVTLVATLFIGAGAASLSNATSSLDTSSDIVVPGQTVTGTISFNINVKNLSVGDNISVSSAFDTPWEATITVKGDESTYTDTVTYKRPLLDCINIMNVGSEAKVTVTSTGTIPNSARGTTIVPLTVAVTSNSSSSGTVQTDSVEVYNTGALASDIVKVTQQISTLAQRIAKYNTPEVVNLGIFFTIPERYVSDAENCLSQAQVAGVTDYTASRYILEAKNKIAIAEKSINELTLQVANEKLNQVKTLINDLKGLNLDVDNISTKYAVYEGTLSGYNTSTDVAKIDELIANIDELYNEATEKLNPSSVAPEFPEWLPWVIIAGIGAIVIAIVIILIVRRHKKNSWDELG